LSPPIAQEEVDGNNNCLRAIVDKTGQQKTMKVGGTGRKGKGRRGGITLFNRVIDIHPLRVGWRNFFSAVLKKFFQPINALWVYGA
jgi:hypothetical protein